MTATNVELRAALIDVLKALEEAPHKHRIDFDPYWIWITQVQEPAIKLAQETLRG